MTPEQEDALVEKAINDAFSFSNYETVRLAIRAAYAQGVAQESEWRDVVLDELIVDHIYTKEHETNPRKALQDAIIWNCQVALDPAVSSDARKLIAQERERCAAICESVNNYDNPMTANDCAAAIRRGD